MTAKWGSCALLAVCLALLVGCRTPQPVLKPDKVAETLVEPPQDRRYDSAGYPKQAFDKLTDPAVQAMNEKNTPGVSPSRGGASPGGLPGR
jgi:hypothetical protein